MGKIYNMDLLTRIHNFLTGITDMFDNYKDCEKYLDSKDLCDEIKCLLYNEYKVEIK